MWAMNRGLEVLATGNGKDEDRSLSLITDSPTRDDEPPALTHRALLYRDREQLERAVRDFVQSAAQAREPVLALLPRANLDWLPSALGELASNVRFEDMSVAGRNPNLLLSLIQEWIDDHDGRGRIISEPVWPGRSYAEVIESLRHEALLNFVLESRATIILCPYDAENLDSETVRGAELTHPEVIYADGAPCSSRHYGDPEELLVGRRWPLQAAPGSASEHPFEGDLGALRRSVERDPALRDLSSERRYDLVFAINEAVTNAVMHSDGKCRMRIWSDDGTVVSEVNSVASLSDNLAGRRRPPLDATDGRGLWLINQVCDLVELRSGEDGTTVRMHVRV
jgi:anti-sigma regulatory factor (Ser/Thr protein kinase)